MARRGERDDWPSASFKVCMMPPLFQWPRYSTYFSKRGPIERARERRVRCDVTIIHKKPALLSSCFTPTLFSLNSLEKEIREMGLPCHGRTRRSNGVRRCMWVVRLGGSERTARYLHTAGYDSKSDVIARTGFMSNGWNCISPWAPGLGIPEARRRRIVWDNALPLLD